MIKTGNAIQIRFLDKESRLKYKEGLLDRNIIKGRLIKNNKRRHEIKQTQIAFGLILFLYLQCLC
jgi:hypothetical protein